MVPRLGLRDEVADLILLAWAALRQRAWYQHGSPAPAPRPGAVRPEMELRPEPLPAPGDWQLAASRAEQIFGIHVSPYLTAAGVAELAGELREDAERPRRCGIGAGRPGRGGLPAPRHSRGPAGTPAHGAGQRRADQVDPARPGPGTAGGRTGRRRPARDRAGTRQVAQPGAEGVAGAGHVPLGSSAAADQCRGARPTRGAGPPRGSWPTCGRPWRRTSSPSSFPPLSIAPSRRSSTGWPRRSHRRLRPSRRGGSRRAGGRAVRAGGEGPDAVLAELRSFLEKHPRDEVTVEWRVSG